MTDKSEKERRKKLLMEVKSAERLRAEAELPASKDELRELIDSVDGRLDACDHTMRHTLYFVRQRGLDEQRVVAWLNQFGGYCDCEVVMNVVDSCPAFK